MSKVNILGWILSGFFIAVSALMAVQAEASGGQVQQNRPLLDIDGNVIGIVVSTNACENYEIVKDQSGKVLYVICVDDD